MNTKPYPHSPTSWRIAGHAKNRIITSDENAIIVAEDLHIADASLIVRAVNERPALLAQNEALRAALREIEEQTQRRQLPITAIVNDIARAALAQTKGAV